MYPADALRTLSQTRSDAKTLSDLGARVLVSGCATTSAFALPLGAIQFTAFAQAKRSLESFVADVSGASASKFGTAVDACASILAALASCTVSVPQEVIKQRLVTGIYPNFGAAVTTIARDEGLRGFYTGALPTVLRNVPFVCITFTVFSHLRTRATYGAGGAGGEAGALSTAQSLQFGIGSAMVACLVTQPVDVVKTRMMTQAASGLAPYTGAMDCVRRMLATEGAPAFFQGLVPRAVYMGPLWAIQFAVNEQLTRTFVAQNNRAETSAA